MRDRFQRTIAIRLNSISILVIAILLAARTSPARSMHADDCPANSRPAATIPFTLIGDHIYIDVTVNRTGPYRFIVDTGGVNLIDAGLARLLSLKITGKEKGHGVGVETVESNKTTIHQLTLGGGAFREQHFYTFDFKELYASGGVEMMGMLGASLFRPYVTCIDFNDRVIDLIDPSNFEPSRAGVRLPMSIRDSEITVPGSFDRLPGTFQMDTGSPTTLTLYAPFVAQHNLLARFPQQVEAANTGVGGSTPAYTVRGRNLVLGSLRIDHPVTSLACGSNGNFARAELSGNVGIGAMKRYVVTFDFPGKHLFLKPYQPAPSDLDTYDRSGMRIEVEPQGFRVVSVANSTPASECDLRPGDLIVAVDGKPASSITLPAVRDDLRKWPAGTIVILEVKSDGKARRVRLKLRNLL